MRLLRRLIVAWLREEQPGDLDFRLPLPIEAPDKPAMVFW